MSWRRLSQAGRLRRHATTAQEIRELAALVERDLRDAAISGLSADRRFATAYNAALQLGKMALACEGWRAAGVGHHQTTFEALPLAFGEEARRFADYFDACRVKRNHVDYDFADAVSETEADELAREAAAFRDRVLAWIAHKHPPLKP